MLAERWMHAEQWAEQSTSGRGRRWRGAVESAVVLEKAWCAPVLEERGPRRDWEQRWSTGHRALA
jgi:hypothetical protein